jgi:hypothetical protein
MTQSYQYMSAASQISMALRIQPMRPIAEPGTVSPLSAPRDEPRSMRSGATAAVGSTRTQPRSSSHISVHACASDWRMM